MKTETALVAPIDLGTAEDVSNLFSHPPNFNAIFSMTIAGKRLTNQLERTVEFYVTSSLKRDGYSDSTASVQIVDGRVKLTITGQTTGDDARGTYSKVLPRFLDIGKIGYSLSVENAKTENWKYNWRFFLPLGIAMANHRSVQLLHFPPDSVLSRDQDYLAASTTRRWARLLTANGVNPSETDSYQNIVDIAPIAAPHADGGNMKVELCATYTKYIVSLLKAALPNGRAVRPMVAFGVPVRQWLRIQFKLPEELGVLSLLTLPLESSLQVPTLTANHPSMIFNLDDNLKDDANTPEDDRLCPLIPTMQEDLIAAGWQARMAEHPASDPRKALDECKETWISKDKTREICQLIYEQVFNKTPEEAAGLVRDKPLPNCAESVVAEPTGSVAMAFREQISKLAPKIGAV
jgi:hypothetical protein